MPVMSNKTVLAAIVFVLSSGTLAHAQSSQSANNKSNNSNNSNTKLVILSTTVDRAAATLTIRGAGFGSHAPNVWRETDPMTVLSASDSELVVSLTEETADGTY